MLEEVSDRLLDGDRPSGLERVKGRRARRRGGRSGRSIAAPIMPSPAPPHREAGSANRAYGSPPRRSSRALPRLPGSGGRVPRSVDRRPARSARLGMLSILGRGTSCQRLALTPANAVPGPPGRLQRATDSSIMRTSVGGLSPRSIRRFGRRWTHQRAEAAAMMFQSSICAGGGGGDGVRDGQPRPRR